MTARRSSAFSRRSTCSVSSRCSASGAWRPRSRSGSSPPSPGGRRRRCRARRPRHELRVLAVQQRDHRPGGERVDLLDEVQRVLVVAVDDDDGEVGVVAGDGLGGLAHADGDLGRRVPELAHLLRGDPQRPGVLIGQEDPQRSLSVRLAHPTSPTRLRLSLHRPSTMLSLVVAESPARPDIAPQHPGARIPVRAPCPSQPHPPRCPRVRYGRPSDRGRRRGARGRARRQPGRAGPRALRALPGQARPGRPRDARRALPAARAPARPPLPAPGGALRRPLPGRVPGPGQGDRPLRPRARGRLLELRGADHPRRDQALLPRPHLVGPRPARPAGARAEGRPRGL